MSAVLQFDTGRLIRARHAHAAAIHRAQAYGYGKRLVATLAAEVKARVLDGWAEDHALRAVVKPKHARVFDPPPEAV